MAATELNLPEDLAAFLSTGEQLQYDAARCDAGKVTLVTLADLKPLRFPVETSSEDFFADDPNYPNVNSYLVLGVDLIASCENYEPEGILLWLPIERRYAAWDSSHCTIGLLAADLKWAQIVSDPIRYIEASLGGDVPMEPLVPWENHPYCAKQVYKPQPA